MENSNAQIFKVKNAGIVLTTPFLPMFFYRLGYLADSRREFIDKEKQIRGIFLLQYLATYSLEVKDSELMLFKIMLNYPLSDPLPCNIELTSKETSLIDELLNSLKINWSKMKNVSNRGFQETFLRREGVYVRLLEPENGRKTLRCFVGFSSLVIFNGEISFSGKTYTG